MTLEADARHAAVARTNIAAAGMSDLVDLRVGPALKLLPELEADDRGAFDLIFIDADKPNNPRYLAWALRLSHPGTVIVGDNVVRDGAVTDSESRDDRVQGVRSFFDMLADDPRVDATALQTVGSKGWDGFVLARVNG